MAITETYVSPGSGNDTTGDGTIGTPWATVQKALDTITRNATDGDRVNVQAGAADTLGATLSLATYGSPSAAAPLIIQGYTSAQGDGGIGEIDGAATYSIYDTTANSNKDGVRFVDMKLGNCGTAVVIYFRFNCALINCEVYGSSAAVGVNLALAGNQAIGCLFHSLTGATNINVGGASFVAYCTIRSSAGTTVLNLSTSGNATVTNCVFDLDTDTSLIAISVGGGGLIANNTIYTSAANTSEGIYVGAGNSFPATIINNIVVGYSGAGGDGLALNSTQFVAYGANAFYNNTAHFTNSAKVAVQLAANITLAGAPFIDAANDDFNLAHSSTAHEAAWPSAFKGMALTGNVQDIGAVQTGPDYPAVGDVEAGVVYDGGEKTGTFVVPTEAQVEDGVGYGAGGTEFEGTLTGGGGGGGPVIGSRIIRGLGAV